MGEQLRSAAHFFGRLVLAAIMLGSLGLYLIVLWWRGPHDLVTWTPCDEWLPFQPEWVWVYLLPYLIGPVAVGCSREKRLRGSFAAARWLWPFH